MIADCQPQLHIAAIHAAPGYNNDTPGIGVLCELAPKTRVAVGTFLNSYYRQSVYAAVVWQPLSVGPVRAGVLAGAVTGYRYDTSVAIPLAALALTVPVRKLELHLAVIPQSSSESPSTAEFSVSYKFR